jgi:hypothetical protein
MEIVISVVEFCHHAKYCNFDCWARLNKMNIDQTLFSRFLGTIKLEPIQEERVSTFEGATSRLSACVTFFSQNSAFFSFEPKEKGEKPDFKATDRKTHGESSPVFGFEKEVF